MYIFTDFCPFLKGIMLKIELDLFSKFEKRTLFSSYHLENTREFNRQTDRLMDTHKYIPINKACVTSRHGIKKSQKNQCFKTVEIKCSTAIEEFSCSRKLKKISIFWKTVLGFKFNYISCSKGTRY